MPRILTYNVHRWLGTDRKTAPGRTAEVIASCEADVVALQEVRLGRMAGGRDQAEVVARLLGMDLHFQPTVRLMGEQFGLAILTGLPSRRVKGGPLPMLTRKPVREERSALWIEIELGSEKLQVVNTHLSLLSDRERLVQASALTGQDWLDVGAGAQAILVGDLNAGPRSKAYKHLASHMRDVQLAAAVPCRLNTFHSRLPLRRIDHVFVSEGIRVDRVDAVRTPLARIASDHVPLLADVRLGVARAVRAEPPAALEAA